MTSKRRKKKHSERIVYAKIQSINIPSYKKGKKYASILKNTRLSRISYVRSTLNTYLF